MSNLNKNNSELFFWGLKDCIPAEPRPPPPPEGFAFTTWKNNESLLLLIILNFLFINFKFKYLIILNIKKNYLSK